MSKKVSNSQVAKPALDPLTEVTRQLAKPTYKDTIKPFAQQVGKAGATVGEMVNVLLSPISLSVYAYRQAEPHIQKKISEAIEKKLAGVPQSKLVAPSPRIAVPVIQSIVHASDEPEIANMFANLLASSMNVDTTTNVHPSFVGIINNLTADEAMLLKVFSTQDVFPLIDLQLHSTETSGYTIILRNFSLLGSSGNYKRPDLMSSYIDNLCRLGLTEIPSGVRISNEVVYKNLDEHPEVVNLKTQLDNKEDNHVEIDHKIIRLTSYGKQFTNVALDTQIIISSLT